MEFLILFIQVYFTFFHSPSLSIFLPHPLSSGRKVCMMTKWDSCCGKLKTTGTRSELRESLSSYIVDVELASLWWVVSAVLLGFVEWGKHDLNIHSREKKTTSMQLANNFPQTLSCRIPSQHHHRGVTIERSVV